ncbi:MAG TPA: hypothetical protein PLJ42_04690 [Chitinophagales bacterium]|jgi:hypothetical protein|nr:hypothetical protein [Chitinophagales bacterium]MBP6154395.1 hypothetical protein [Chitinophagales bacterium]HQV77989.1 hypothetical protein [Chitinophagales bacterium]HQW78711.1 hypothetical protein [Chitinophagales bacterium]HRB18562.1 hypothetical protein [Chitinophagales bacterium]
MKKTSNKTILLLIFIAIQTMLSSCSQDVTEYYEDHKLVFWFDEETSRSLLDDGAETLTFYVDNKVVATSSVDDVYWETAPLCDDSEAISTKALLSNKRNSFLLKVVDQTGFEYYTDVKNTIHPQSCNAIKIGISRLK